MLDEYMSKYEKISHEFSEISEAKRQITQEFELKDKLLRYSKQTMSDKRERLTSILKANIQRLKQELIFVKKSAVNELEMMRKSMNAVCENIIFKS